MALVPIIRTLVEHKSYYTVVYDWIGKNFPAQTILVSLGFLLSKPKDRAEPT